MLNKILYLKGFDGNGNEEKTDLAFAGIINEDGDVFKYYQPQNGFDSWFETFRKEILLENSNIFVYDLEAYASHFIIQALLRNGYQFFDRSDIDPIDKFAIGEQGRFTVYTKVGNDYKIVNFIEIFRYLDKSVDVWGYTRHFNTMNVDEFPYMPYGIALDKSYRDEVKSICTALDLAMQAHDFYRCFENRLYAKPSIAMQLLQRNVERLPLQKIKEFEPLEKYRGYRGNYQEKRYSKVKLTAPRGSLPQSFEIDESQYSVGSKDWFMAMEREIKEHKELLEAGVFTDWREKQKWERWYNQGKKYHYAILTKELRKFANPVARFSYRSGYNYLPPEKTNEWLTGRLGVTVDENGQYAHHYSTKKFPKNAVGIVGSLEEFEKRYGHDNYLYIAMITRIVATVKDGKAPTIRPDRRNFEYTGIQDYSKLSVYYRHIDFSTPLNLSQPDFEYLLRNYDIETLEYKLLVYDVDWELMDLLKQHKERWAKIKEQAKAKGDIVEYNYAKDNLNYVVGGLGARKTNPATPSYVAVANFINSYARCQTAELINKLGMDLFCYCAVDSLHFLLPESCLTNGKYDFRKLKAFLASKLGIELHPTKTGAWKVESVWNKAKFLNINIYGERDLSGEFITRVAGINRPLSEEELSPNHPIPIQVRTAVEGGTILKTVTKELPLSYDGVEKMRNTVE